MLSVYVLLQIPLDSDFIAAALTILGYSINASIIVFDRVRENLRTARKEPFEVIGEKSIWQTMGRTINTTLTTLFTIGMVYILGVPSLQAVHPAADRRYPGRRLVVRYAVYRSVGLLPLRSSAAAARSERLSRKGTRSGAFFCVCLSAQGSGEYEPACGSSSTPLGRCRKGAARRAGQEKVPLYHNKKLT